MKWLFIYIAVTGSTIVGTHRDKSEGKIVKTIHLNSDSTRVDLMIAFSQQSLDANPDSAIYWAQKAVEESRIYKLIKKEAKAFGQLGKSHFEKVDYQSALMAHRNALRLFSEISDLEGKFNAHINIGSVLQHKSELKEAAVYYELALNIALKNNNDQFIAEAFTALGVLAYYRGDHAEALKNYINAEVHYEIVGNKIKLALLNNNIGIIYKVLGDYDNALLYYIKSIDQLREMGEESLLIGKLQAQNQAEQEKRIAAIEQREKDYQNMGVLAKQKIWRNTFIIGFLIVLIISIMLYRNYRRKSKAYVLLRMKNKEILKQKKELWIQRDRLSQMNLEIEMQKEFISDQNKNLSLKNQELEQLNLEKDSLLGIVAHDLRAPLNRSKGLAELLKLDGTLNAAQKKYIKMMVNVCNEGIKLTKDLLSMHYYEQSDNELKEEKISINKFFDQLLKGYHNKLIKKDLQLHYQPLTRDIQFLTDPHYLTRIVDNLFSNAIKFTFPGKSIYLKVTTNAKSVFICIKDEGQGISKEEQTHMFKKFHKLSALPTGGELSTGLGLSIVDNLIKKLGGEIRVNSKVGVGTEINLKFGNKPDQKGGFNLPERIRILGYNKSKTSQEK